MIDNALLTETAVRIQSGHAVLDGLLAAPPDAQGMVILAHGATSSRLSPRTQRVARRLHDAGFGTLVVDLLMWGEGHDRSAASNVEQLTHRLKTATLWVKGRPGCGHLPVGYLAAGTDAAVAMRAAAEFGPLVRSVVSRSGRADLVLPLLDRLDAPTLLVVGGLDTDLVELNRRACALIGAKKALLVLAGVSQRFDEPDTLDQFAREAVRWFRAHLACGRRE